MQVVDRISRVDRLDGRAASRRSPHSTNRPDAGCTTSSCGQPPGQPGRGRRRDRIPAHHRRLPPRPARRRRPARGRLRTPYRPQWSWRGPAGQALPPLGAPDRGLPPRPTVRRGRPLLADALEDAETSGDSPRQALERRAGLYGESVGRAARKQPGSPLAKCSRAHGFEPRETARPRPGQLPVPRARQGPHRPGLRHDPAPASAAYSPASAIPACGPCSTPTPHCCVRLTPLGFEGGEG